MGSGDKTKLIRRLEALEAARRHRQNNRHAHLTLAELRVEVQKFVSELRSRPKDEQLAFARDFPDDSLDSPRDHRQRLKVLNPQELALYAKTKLSMLLFEPIRNEAAAEVVMRRISSHGGGRLERCACSSCSPLRDYQTHREMFLGRDPRTGRHMQH
jgi:hypothetical protein